MEIGNIEFVKELDGNYLVLEALGEATFPERMLLYGRPGRILPFRIYQEEPRRYSYEISGRESLSAISRCRALEGGEIRELLRSVYLACEELEQYLLKPDSLILEPGLMYRNREGWAFCCHPGQEEEISGQLQRLSRFFLRKCDHEEPATAALAYELFQLCHEENVTFLQILEFLGESTDPGRGSRQTVKKKVRRGLFRRNG